MPKLTWKADGPFFAHSFAGAKSDGKPKSVTRWAAESDTRDFRTARWDAARFVGDIEKYSAVRRHGAEHFEAYFLEFEYEIDGRAFPLCTQIQILEPKK